MELRVGVFQTDFVSCATSHPTFERARAAIAAMLEIGCDFRFGLDTNTDPYSRIHSRGVRTMTFRHSALRVDGSYLSGIRSPSTRIVDLTKAEGPTANFDYLSEQDRVTFVQSGDIDDAHILDEMALGQLLLATELQPHLSPGYGWIDEGGGNFPTVDLMRPGQPGYLFWANFFGPEHVAAFGHEFLAGAPGWRIVDFPDGGVLFVGTRSYSAWRRGKNAEILSYFRQRLPTVHLYLPAGIPDC
jgi:hypothetical protein